MCILCVPALLFTRKQLLPRIAVKVGTVCGYSGRERRLTYAKPLYRHSLASLNQRFQQPQDSRIRFTQPHAGTVP